MITLPNSRISLIFLILFLNAWRFIGLEISPPGFYLDEAAGATQIICLKETWRDFYGNAPGLFTAGFPGFGLYTPIYVYGEMLWTSVFGNAIWAFRSFLALTTSLTVYFLYLWVRNISSDKTALYVAFAASISPWAFQFSRIAWDPPLAVLFLVIALWISTLKKWQWLYGGFLALAAYSYPPMRITAVLIGVFLPGISLNNKLKAGLIFLAICIPIILQVNNPEFMARSNATAIWGNDPRNPYLNESTIGLVVVAWQQFSSFFKIDFLFLSGDSNLRHSVQAFGMLSWLDGLAYLAGFAIIATKFIGNKRNSDPHSYKPFLITILIGLIATILPSALTHDGNPNSLRAIGAWPFFSALTGFCLTIICQKIRWRYSSRVFIAGGLIFYAAYLTHYFSTYPTIAKDWFATEHKKITFSYLRMSQENLSCSDARNEPNPRSPSLNPPIPAFNTYIDFGNNGQGKHYLNYHWYEQENWGIWSSHNTSKVIFPLNGAAVNTIQVKLKAFLPEGHADQKIEIFVNKHSKGIFILASANENLIDIDIKKSDIPQDNLELKFKIINPLSPKNLGINPDDGRKIGIGLMGINLKTE